MNASSITDVYWAADVAEANLMKNLLADAGIEAHVVGDKLQEYPPGLATAPRVWVTDADADRARAVIAEWKGRREQRRATGEEEVWTCPNCNASVEADFDLCWNCQQPRNAP